jgi:hypothetical protein
MATDSDEKDTCHHPCYEFQPEHSPTMSQGGTDGASDSAQKQVSDKTSSVVRQVQK